MSEMMSLQLDQNMVKVVLEKQIQSAILANMGDADKLIEKVVGTALHEKVNRDGVKSNYSSENVHDFLEVLTGKAIREAAKDALKDWLETNKVLVKEAVYKELSKPERQETLARAFADEVENAMGCSWNFKCDINFQRNND
ncbi:MAG TPA: hypothetical protein VMV86_05710 [Methanosarcinales archaeon]|nr:hypothetical protein [Methanosarcinales archaeon]